MKQLTELPKFWEQTSLRSICKDIVGGGTPSTKVNHYWEGNIPWISSADILGLRNIVPRRKITAEAINSSATNKVPEGTIIVVTRVGLGKIGIAPYKLCFSQDNQGLIFHDGVIETDYALLFLSTAVQLFKHSGRGTTISGVTKKQLGELVVQIPPLAEQKQIAIKVDEIFSDLDNAIENFKRVQDQLKVFRQAVLKYAFTGKLSNCGNIWETKPLGQACQVVSGNTPKGVNEIYSVGEIPFYKVSDMNTEGNEVYLKKSKINLSYNDCKKLKLKTYPAGTVVFPKRGGAILTNKKRILSKESAFDLNLMGVVPNDKVLERFLFNWFLLLDLGRLCDGSNVPQINHGDIEPLDFPFMSTEIQKEVIGEIEKRLSVCKHLEDTLDENLRKAEALRQSILKQAFEGKLTEQWRKDHRNLISGENSAEALLKKIKAEKEALLVKPKGKKKHD